VDAGRGSDATRTIVIVVVLAAGFALLPRAMKALSFQAEGREAPDFTAPIVANAAGADQTKLTLSELRGKAVILDFWATWCGPCQAETPIVNGVAQRYRDKGLVVVGVNTSDSPGLAEKYAKHKGLVFPIVFDVENQVAHHFGVDNLPTLIVLSKEGKIVAVRHGITSDADLDHLVKQVL
jgi:thiol-disulfide isomerase/thioredoxin